MKTTRYELVQRAGIWLDRWTAQLWDKLVAKFPGLILTQGVNSGAAASAGTHRGLGVLDLYLGRWAAKWRDVLRYAFDIGFFGWYRPELWVWRAGKKVREWKTHMHLGVRGCVRAAASLKAQFTSWLRGRNGLQGDGRDAFTYRPKSASKAAPYSEPKPAKPPKPARKIYPWFNVAFLNGWGNSVEGGRNFLSRVVGMARSLGAGRPAVIGYAELREGQVSALSKELGRKGRGSYRLVAYSEDNMVAAFARPHVKVLGYSFSKFSKQHGGNVEGVLRVKFIVGGSRAQVGIVHLDHDSPVAFKRSNLTETVAALERYGNTMPSDWKARTVIMGDLNHPTVGETLEALGFKNAGAGAAIDEIYVGEDRALRGAGKNDTNSDHPRVWAKLGRYSK
ncbi:endonuclease/exonuclease/phosphatase family protein [Aeromicrobium endophyticum]|uniref:Endonuclease/exonuclease/phosphatase domain-containing protein n=1 Tax=Aeromicrobium endophyticum TaxID=2292704 RepID=A0A371PCG9_9ACTN|nr:hypothetical protein [Aeromicrobium endophyticum]REK73634.1 hypothetical protein DX116_08900 [Aeromicrobium endophyticum]